jgi:hypothetical protein
MRTVSLAAIRTMPDKTSSFGKIRTSSSKKLVIQNRAVDINYQLLGEKSNVFKTEARLNNI